MRFGVVGSGWRSKFFIKLASLMPDKFKITGIVSRSDERRTQITKNYGVSSFDTVDALINRTEPEFIITSVPWDINPEVISTIIERNIAVLSETPPAQDIEGLIHLYQTVQDNKGRVQVAEQYHLRPHHQVQLKIAASQEYIGKPYYSMVSAGHGYHGISLLRKALGIRTEDAQVWSTGFSTPILKGPDRSGFQPDMKIDLSRQNIYVFKFSNEKVGLIDFTEDQYFGFIRNERTLIRGVTGEISNLDVYWMQDHQNPRKSSIERIETGKFGDINGNHLISLTFNGKEYYVNPFQPQPLMDEEIAVAHILEKMHEYVKTNQSFYSLAEACQDHYLYQIGLNSQKSGTSLSTSPQIWTNDI